MQDNYILPVKHVSHTAWLVAAFRAQESERPDAHFRDPLAKKLLGGLENDYLSKFSKEERSDHWLLAVRTWQIDQLIQKAIQNGVRTIFNLGAGLDTRPYRLSLPVDLLTQISWFEADFPDVVAYKNKTLEKDIPRCKLNRISIDLGNKTERLSLLNLMNQQVGPSLVLTEGLLAYLPHESVSELAQDLILTTSCEYWLMDVFNRSILAVLDNFRNHEVRQSENDGVQLKFMPESMVSFLAPFGWELKDFLSFRSGAIQLNRYPKGMNIPDFTACHAFHESGICLFKSKEKAHGNC